MPKKVHKLPVEANPHPSQECEQWFCPGFSKVSSKGVMSVIII